MPIYEYRRPDGSTFEVTQSFSDEALKTDPETGVAVERVLHAPAVHFKGSGFYDTDYGSRKRQRENASSESGAGAEKAKGDSESKGSSDGASSNGASSSSTEKSSSEKAKTASGSKAASE